MDSEQKRKILQDALNGKVDRDKLERIKNLKGKSKRYLELSNGGQDELSMIGIPNAQSGEWHFMCINDTTKKTTIWITEEEYERDFLGTPVSFIDWSS